MEIRCGTTCYVCLLRSNILYQALDLGMIVRVFLLFLCPTLRPPWIEHSVMGWHVTFFPSPSVFQNHLLFFIGGEIRVYGGSVSLRPIIFTIYNQHNKPVSCWEGMGIRFSFSYHFNIPKYDALHIDAHWSHGHCRRNEDSGNARQSHHVCMGAASARRRVRRDTRMSSPDSREGISISRRTLIWTVGGQVSKPSSSTS